MYVGEEDRDCFNYLFGNRLFVTRSMTLCYLLSPSDIFWDGIIPYEYFPRCSDLTIGVCRQNRPIASTDELVVSYLTLSMSLR